MYKLYIFNRNKKDYLDYILNKYLSKYDIIYNKDGKPYIKGNKLYFNISHSHNITALVVSDKEVGIDIEKITYHKNVINHAFTDNEKKLCHNHKDFTIIWIKKESYLKYMGCGIGYGLKNIDTTKIKGFKIRKYKDYYISIYL